HDVRERGLAEARRAEQQQVVERLGTVPGGRHEDVELLADAGLPDVVGQRPRPQGPFDDLLAGRSRCGGDETVVLDHALTSDLSACRMPSETSMPAGSLRLAASASRSE